MSEDLPAAKRPKLEELPDTTEIHQLEPEKPMATLLLKVKKLSKHATLPVRASARAAGYDLFAAHEHNIPANGKALIKTDLSLAIPAGHYGRIAPRSSLAWKNHIDVGAGVIDEDYRGPLGVVLFNFSSENFAGTPPQRYKEEKWPLQSERFCCGVAPPIDNLILSNPPCRCLYVFVVNKGDRVAQLIIEKISNPEVVEVDDLDEVRIAPSGCSPHWHHFNSSFQPYSDIKHSIPRAGVDCSRTRRIRFHWSLRSD